MEDTLKRLLDAELEAEELVDKVTRECDQITAQARDEAQRAEERFEARIPELRHSYVSKAESRAEQSINELRRRYDERRQQLIKMAEEGQEEALDQAIAVILDTGHF